MLINYINNFMDVQGVSSIRREISMNKGQSNCPCGNHCPVIFRMSRIDPRTQQKIYARRGHPFPIPLCSLRH
nr:MAG TPA: hypothetical protein [Caudoviricetes sp.]